MARKSPTTLPAKKFLGKYWKPILDAHDRERRAAQGISLFQLLASREAGDELPGFVETTKLWNELRQWWPIRLLQAAAAENDAEGFKRVLHHFLIRLGVNPPQGVLVPFRWKVGRPQETGMIYAAWIASGAPRLDWRTLDGLAKAFYPNQFSQALSDPKLRKNLRDRVGNAIRRHQPPATKPQRIS